jgi:YHS domain-containing protein
MRGCILLVFLVILTGRGFAQTEYAKPLPGSTAVAPADSVKILPPGSKTVWNTVCPVMDEEVDNTLPVIEYKGKIIGVCCNVCLKKFKKEPDKYLSRLTPDGKAIKED